MTESRQLLEKYSTMMHEGAILEYFYRFISYYLFYPLVSF